MERGAPPFNPLQVIALTILSISAADTYTLAILNGTEEGVLRQAKDKKQHKSNIKYN